MMHSVRSFRNTFVSICPYFILATYIIAKYAQKTLIIADVEMTIPQKLSFAVARFLATENPLERTKTHRKPRVTVANRKGPDDDIWVTTNYSIT